MRVYTEIEVKKLIKAFERFCEKNCVPFCEFSYYPEFIEVDLIAKENQVTVKKRESYFFCDCEKQEENKER